MGKGRDRLGITGRDRRKGKKLGKSKGEVLEKRYGSERRGWFGAGGCERACKAAGTLWVGTDVLRVAGWKMVPKQLI